MNKTTKTTLSPAQLDQLSINTIRFLSVDAVQKAESGHPGLPLGAAPMAYVVWTRFLRHHPANPHWFDRDRFVLSADHGSMLLYSLLHLTGYDLPLEQIKRFRQWDSITPGHPERSVTPGVETTTGPLGQGFGNGVGLAIAEAHLAARYNRPGLEVVNHFTYGLVSENYGMEGEATDSGIETLRKRRNKNFLLTLFVSRGIPMSLGGDEFRRTQRGNNNAYCQDNEHHSLYLMFNAGTEEIDSNVSHAPPAARWYVAIATSGEAPSGMHDQLIDLALAVARFF